MRETLREVAPNLWVSDIESAEILGEDFDIVVDCTGKGPTHGMGGVRTVKIVPTGKTNHRWTYKDLENLSKGTVGNLRHGKKILIHCRRGISRSATGAAAVLLRMGKARNVAHALKLVQFGGSRPNSHSVAGLKEWWDEYQSKRQVKLLVDRHEARQQERQPRSA